MANYYFKLFNALFSPSNSLVINKPIILLIVLIETCFVSANAVSKFSPFLAKVYYFNFASLSLLLINRIIRDIKASLTF
jgi:hypothetical protein